MVIAVVMVIYDDSNNHGSLKVPHNQKQGKQHVLTRQLVSEVIMSLVEFVVT